MKWHKLLSVIAIACSIACTPIEPDNNEGDNNENGNNTGNTDTPNTTVIDTTRLVGADLSQWLAYRNDNAEWYCNGEAIDNLPAFFAQNGYKTARLRLFVNPDRNSTACQDIDYVIESAQAMKQAGMEICLDFHYSDTWADPGKQTKPAEWESLDAIELAYQVYQYTHETLLALKAENITPTLIQIGNEITAGMLWNTGRVSVWEDGYNTPEQWSNFTLLLNNAAKACREVCPDAKIIIHIDRGGDAATSLRYYEKITSVDYDVIGLSYYPYWHGSLTQLGSTVNQLSTKFPNKEIMIMETGFGYNEWSDDSASAQYGNYASTPDGQKKMMSDLVNTLKKYNHVTGLFYWFPEETKIDWRSTYRIDLNRGLFDKESGEVLPAFYTLPEFTK